jgi:hypothetical protein
MIKKKLAAQRKIGNRKNSINFDGMDFVRHAAVGKHSMKEHSLKHIYCARHRPVKPNAGNIILLARESTIAATRYELARVVDKIYSELMSPIYTYPGHAANKIGTKKSSGQANKAVKEAGTR